MTRYKRKIYEIVTSSHSHPTAEQVLELLRQSYPRVAPATVYNNLNSLCAEGRIRRIPLDGRPDRYDDLTRHDHLVCCWCGALADVRLPDLMPLLQQQLDVPLLAYDLRLRYRCAACSRAP